MTEVPHIEGPSGPPENIQRKDRSSPDADKFKKEMTKKVGEVTETDPEQKKKGKRSEEEEPEEKGPTKTEARPASEVTPFSLEAQKKEISPLEMQSGDSKTSPMDSAQAAKPAPENAPSPIFLATPSVNSSDEIEDDAGMWGETAQMEEMPSSSDSPPTPQPISPPEEPPSSQPASYAQTPPDQSEMSTQAPQQVPAPQSQTEAPSSNTDQKQQQQQTPVSSQSQPATQQTTPQQSSSETTDNKSAKLSPTKGTVESERKPASKQTGRIAPKRPSGADEPSLTADQLEKIPPPSAEDAATLLEKMGAEKQMITSKADKIKEKIASGLEDAPGAAALTPAGATAKTHSEHDKKKEGFTDKTQTNTGFALGTGVSQEITPAATMQPPPPYTAMTPQILDLYERMVGTMTIMTSEGINETVITLNSPQFASSVFYGSQIIIHEYSTAPKIFNIQLNGNTAQATALFQANTGDLMAAFQFGNHNFRVNRLDTGYAGERPEFSRKEKTSGDKDGQPGAGE